MLPHSAATRDPGGVQQRKLLSMIEQNADTDYGRDLHIELDSEPLRSARQYRRMLEVTMGADHWLRSPRDRWHASRARPRARRRA